MFNVYKTNSGEMGSTYALDLGTYVSHTVYNRIPSLSFGKKPHDILYISNLVSGQLRAKSTASRLNSSLYIFKDLAYADFNIRANQIDIAPVILNATYNVYQDTLNYQKDNRFNISKSPVCIAGNCELFIDTLNSLEGGPMYVGGSFTLVGVNPVENDGDVYGLSRSPLNLTSLKGAPLYVGSTLRVENTKIKNCEHAPLYIGQGISLCYNPELETLKGLPIGLRKTIRVTNCPKLTTSGLLEGPRDIEGLECDAVHFFGNTDPSSSAYEEFGSRLKDIKLKYLSIQAPYSYIEKLLNTLSIKASNASNRDRSKIEEQINLLTSTLNVARTKTSKMGYRGTSTVRYGSTVAPSALHSLRAERVNIAILLDL
jgi:hypothetical protein